MNPAILFLLISASSEVYGRERDNRDQPDPPDTYRESIGKGWNEQNKRGHLEQPKIFADREVRKVDRQNGKELERGGMEGKEQNKRDQMEQLALLKSATVTSTNATERSVQRTKGITPFPLNQMLRRVGRQIETRPKVNQEDPDDMGQMEESINLVGGQILKIAEAINETIQNLTNADIERNHYYKEFERIKEEMETLPGQIEEANATVNRLKGEMQQAEKDIEDWSTERDKAVKAYDDSLSNWADFKNKVPKLDSKMMAMRQSIKRLKGFRKESAEQREQREAKINTTTVEYEKLELICNITELVENAVKWRDRTIKEIQEPQIDLASAINRPNELEIDRANYGKELNDTLLEADELTKSHTQLGSDLSSAKAKKERLEADLVELKRRTTTAETTEMPHTTTTTKEEDAKKEEPFVGSPLFWSLVALGCLALVAVIGGGIYFFFFHGANNKKVKSTRKTKKDFQPKKVVDVAKPAEPESRNPAPTVVDPMMTTRIDGGDNQMDTTGRTTTLLDTAFGETGPMTTTSDEANKTETDSEGSSLLDSTGPTNLFGSREGWTGRGGIPR